ncbi:hypothetical protein BGX34_010416 [Mortierella sp. NVP85]|nr:hypothetical protein BGX34_010416 [Mortierella sp. NVP85]
MAPYLRNSISTTPVHMDPDQELLSVAQRHQQDMERMAMMAMSLEHLHLQPLGCLLCTTQIPNRNGAVSKVVRIGIGLQHRIRLAGYLHPYTLQWPFKGWVHTMPGEYACEDSKKWDDDLTCWQVYPADPKIRQKYSQHKQALKNNSQLDFEGYVSLEHQIGPNSGPNFCVHCTFTRLVAIAGLRSPRHHVARKLDTTEIRLHHCYSKVALATNDKVSLGSNMTFLREVRGMKWSKQPVEEAIWTVELVPGLADHYGNMKTDMQPPPADASTGDRFRLSANPSRQLDEASRAEADERLKRMAAAAESRAKEMQEKQQLVANKEALEQKKRELEERLAAHEKELEHQRQQLKLQREREEQKRQKQAVPQGIHPRET